MFIFNLRLIHLAYVGFLLIVSQNAYSVYSDFSQMNPEGQQVIRQGQNQNITDLLVEHGVLLNKAILAALNNEPQSAVEAGKAQLLQNSHQIANIITSVFGSQTGETFESLFNQHILLGAQFINAVKANDEDTANQISNQAKANGRALANFFSTLNSSIPAPTWQNMWDQHVTIEAEQTKAYFKGDMNRANQLRDQSLVQLKEMGSLVISALQRQPVQMNR